jgi:hypothetical protein
MGETITKPRVTTFAPQFLVDHLKRLRDYLNQGEHHAED